MTASARRLSLAASAALAARTLAFGAAVGRRLSAGIRLQGRVSITQSPHGVVVRRIICP